MQAMKQEEQLKTKEETQSSRFVGRPLSRLEDSRFMTGSATYIDDMKMHGLVHAAFLRSPFAHARITRIDTSKAEALTGVTA